MDAILSTAQRVAGRLIAGRHTSGGRWRTRFASASLDMAAGRCTIWRELDVERAFALDDRRDVTGLRTSRRESTGRPFALTANRGEAALRSGCHYVDINGEVDVYKRLDDLELRPERGLAIVCGAGHSAVASELLLEERFNT